MTDAWMQTKSGEAFDLLEPDHRTINIADIAYHLAGINRYTGATRLTVAQHGVLCAAVAPPGLEFECLMHDAHEAYSGDQSAPLKQAMRVLCRAAGDGQDWLATIERIVDTAVRVRYGMHRHMPDAVRAIDLRMLRTEQLQLHSAPPKPWKVEHLAPFVGLRIDPWPADRAEAEFLQAFVRYGGPARTVGS